MVRVNEASYQSLIDRLPVKEAPAGATHAVVSTCKDGVVYWRRLEVMGNSVRLRTLYPVQNPDTGCHIWVPHTPNVPVYSHRLLKDRHKQKRLTEKYGVLGSDMIKGWGYNRLVVPRNVLQCFTHGIGLPNTPFEGEVGDKFLEKLEAYNGVMQAVKPDIGYTQIEWLNDANLKQEKPHENI